MAKFWFRYCTVPVCHMKWPQPSVFKQLFSSICNVSAVTGLYRDICNTVGMATKGPRCGAKLRKPTTSFVMSVLPHGTTRLPLDVFSCNSVFQYFSKFCPENSGFIKMWQEWRVLYMKTHRHLWQYLAHFFLEWEMFQTKGVEKIKTHIFCSIIFYFAKIVSFMKQCGETEEPCRPQMTIWRMRFSCCVPKATNTLSEFFIFIVAPCISKIH